MCSEAEAFSWAMIEAVHGERDVFTDDGIEAQLLGGELANEPVHVFVGSALPGA